jgi:hypothetical protein
MVTKVVKWALPYVGPGDIVPSATGWWGLRAYSAASIGTNAVRLRENGGNTEQDFATIAGGGLPLDTIATFKGANNLFVTKLFDQTGNGFDKGQTTAALQPELTLAGLGLLPVMTFTGSESLSTGLGNVSQIYSISAVAIRTGGGSTGLFWSAGGSNQVMGFRFNFGSNTASVLWNGPWLDATATDNVWHALQGIANDTSSSVIVDGVTTTGAAGASTATNPYEIGNSGSFPLTGKITELGLWHSDITASVSSLNSNQHTYWGF